MDLWVRILNLLKIRMEKPDTFGGYHMAWLLITVGLTVLLCSRFRNCRPETVEKVVLWVAVAVSLLEIYKQTVLTFYVENGAVAADYPWHIFPWQFCSTPMYVGLLTAVFRKGKIHDALYAYLATYVIFGGLCVMLFPGDVFMDLVGINIQTMVCHSSMIIVGFWLLATGYVPLGAQTVWKAGVVFLTALAIAVGLNEFVWHTGLSGGDVFNMFYVSPHFPGTLVVYRWFQQVVPYPWCLLVYIGVFTLGAILMMGAAQRILGRHPMTVRRQKAA